MQDKFLFFIIITSHTQSAALLRQIISSTACLAVTFLVGISKMARLSEEHETYRHLLYKFHLKFL